MCGGGLTFLHLMLIHDFDSLRFIRGEVRQVDVQSILPA